MTAAPRCPARPHRPRFLPLAAAVLMLAACLPFVAHADGTVNGVIGAQYGATRAIDGDADASCQDTQDRGDLIDFHAFSNPAGNGSRWFFAFTIDSDAALASGDLNSPTYFIILDDPNSAGANGSDTIPFYNSAGSGYSGGWRRNMVTPGTHYVGCYPNNGTDLICDLYDNYKQEVAGVDFWTVNTAPTVGGRRYVEMALPDDPDVPTYLRNNTAINTMVISTYNSDNYGNPIDAAGNGVSLNCHNNAKEGGGSRAFAAGDLIGTAANCKTTGRPTDAGTNDRQCISLPARTTTPALTDIATCSATTAGVVVNGTATNDNYTQLTEAGFAGPYQGGDASRSDFQGESASYRFCDASGNCTGVTGADIVNVYARGDAYFLYLVVAGELDSFGRSGGGADRANLFLPIDLPDVTSSSAEANTTGVPNNGEFPNAPGGRYVNFKGWDVDAVVELIWHGNVNDTNAAKLYRYAGARTWTSTAFTVMAAKDTGDHTNVNPPTAANLYYGRDVKTYEFAIPWAALGYTAWTGGTGSNPPACAAACRPTSSAAIKVGAYTTADSNAVSGEDNWDVYDQAPGIGQGGNGQGSHERLGDEWQDADDDRAGGEADRTPYSGLTRNTSDRSASDPDGYDVDTLESYFQFTLAPKDRECLAGGEPLAVNLANFTATLVDGRPVLAWETVSEQANAGFDLYRGESEQGPWVKLTASLIPAAAPGSAEGHAYTWTDTTAVQGTYWYRLEDVDLSGSRTSHGPVRIDLAAPNAVSVSGFTARFDLGELLKALITPHR